MRQRLVPSFTTVAVLAGVLTTGVAAATPAAAVPLQNLTVCATGNYAGSVEAPQAGLTTTVPRGQCTTLRFYGSWVKLRGFWNTSPGRFYIDAASLPTAPTNRIRLFGTTADPRWDILPGF